MKIALLTLPIDNNYGGNLQRYALMTVLQRMGHDVIHIYLLAHARLPWYKVPFSYVKRLFKKFILCDNTVVLSYERITNERYEKSLHHTKLFYEKYIKHTNICYTIQDIKKECKGRYEAYLVGSDQVWRNHSTRQIDIKEFFLSFTLNEDVKRYAYSVSLGKEDNMFSEKEIKNLGQLYHQFNSVSVREISALRLFEQYGWNNPLASLCLDPTLLLDAEDYLVVIRNNKVEDMTGGKIFAYILDESDNNNKTIQSLSKQLSKSVICTGLENSTELSIPQWLNDIRCADFVITDSYHGTVFSIIFKKPFLFLGNQERGNARISSLFDILHIHVDKGIVSDYAEVDTFIKQMRKESMDFLKRIP